MHIGWRFRPRSGLPLRRRLLLSLAAGVVPLLVVALVTTLLVRTVSQDFARATQRAHASAQISDIEARITGSGSAILGALSSKSQGARAINAYLAANRSVPTMFDELARDVPPETRGAVGHSPVGWRVRYTDLERAALILSRAPGTAEPRHCRY